VTVSRFEDDARVSQTGRNVAATVVAISGGIGLLISAMGVFGVVAYTTAQRRREFGIRLAMGSAPAGLVALVLREGSRVLVASSVVGVLLGFGVTRVLGSFLFGVRPTDPLVLGAGVVVMCAVGLLATDRG
jgi:ABC-type antimicrobial peptide transport system permease subunit